MIKIKYKTVDSLIISNFCFIDLISCNRHVTKRLKYNLNDCKTIRLRCNNNVTKR